jgi:hypothetical protein
MTIFNQYALVKTKKQRHFLYGLGWDLPKYTIIDAPSILGLRLTGVEDLPESLK